MKNKSFIQTVLRGLILIVPIIGFFYIFREFYQFISTQIDHVMETTTIDNRFLIFLGFIASVLVIIGILYLVGLTSQTKPVHKFTRWLDGELVQISDVYRKIKLNIDNTTEFTVDDHPPIFVQFGEAERPGFLMELHNDIGKATVFIPKNFNDFNGHVYIVFIKHIRYAKAESTEFVASLDHLGEGLDIS